MSATFFISDVHLGAENPEKEIAKKTKLKAFLHSIAGEADKLIILGDLFDFWFDYKTVVLAHDIDVVCELKNLRDRFGTEIILFGGNHDRWMSDNGALANLLDAKIFPDHAILDIDEKKIFLSHGDGIAKSDWGYRKLLKPILTNRFAIALFRLIPAEWACKIARAVSSTSKLYTGERNLRFENEYEAFASEMLAKNIDIVILGHTHLPKMIQMNGGIYANTGDFFENFSYIVLEDGKLDLKQFK